MIITLEEVGYIKAAVSSLIRTAAQDMKEEIYDKYDELLQKLTKELE